MLHNPGVSLSWGDVVFIALGAARGMQHLHALGVVHRDLKSGEQHAREREGRERDNERWQLR